MCAAVRGSLGASLALACSRLGLTAGTVLWLHAKKHFTFFAGSESDAGTKCVSAYVCCSVCSSFMKEFANDLIATAHASSTGTCGLEDSRTVVSIA